MVWTPSQNGRQSLAEEDLPVDSTLQEKRKTAAVMEEANDGLHEKQKHENRCDRRQKTPLSFGNG